MNKQLLTATLVAISSLAYANTEMPNYDFMPIDRQQYCEQNQTELCKEIAALFAAAQQLRDETGVIHFTEEQAEQMNKLHAALEQEIAQTREIGIKGQNTEEDILNQDQPKNEELTEKLNPTIQE